MAPLLLTVGIVSVEPARAGVLLLVAGLAGVLVVCGLTFPVAAVVMLLAAQFLRLPLSGVFPADPFLPAFVGVLGAATIALSRPTAPQVRLGVVEVVMALYVLWNIYSMVLPHHYAAKIPLTGEEYSTWRLVLVGTVIPFTLYSVGRYVISGERAVRCLLWVVLGFTAYSAAVSHLQIFGPTSLVWPRYILDTAWSGRAVGIVNQPVANGLVLVVGFVVALLLAAHSTRWTARAGALLIGAAAAYGVLLTYTRAVWLAFAVVLVIGAVFATRFRAGFLLTAFGAVTLIAANWSTFLSADRSAGGIGSAGELEDRLNIIATSLWAIEQQPFVGWGIGRFVVVNTYHHQQWSWDTPWQRGFGLSSHFNELGIGAELGLVGLALWCAVLVLVAARLVRALRVLRGPGLVGRGLAVLAMSSFAALICAGFTVDLRFLDFPSTMVMVLAGLAVGFSDRVPEPVPFTAGIGR